TVHVGRQLPKGRVLPTVSNVNFDASGGELLGVTGRIRNPYRKAMSQDAAIYAVFLNGRGGIVGGATDVAGAEIRARETVSFRLEGVVNNPNSHAVRARVSVDPCSDFDPSCAALGHR